MPKSPEGNHNQAELHSVCPAMENTDVGRLMLPPSPSFFICQAAAVQR